MGRTIAGVGGAGAMGTFGRDKGAEKLKALLCAACGPAIVEALWHTVGERLANTGSIGLRSVLL